MGAATDERAAIVAWLRGNGRLVLKDNPTGFGAALANLINFYAGAIEEGYHLDERPAAEGR